MLKEDLFIAEIFEDVFRGVDFALVVVLREGGHRDAYPLLSTAALSLYTHSVEG